MKIAIDIDGVTINLIQMWIDKFHPNLKIEDLSFYNIWELPNMKCTRDQFFREIDELDGYSAIFYKGSIEAIKKLSKIHDVFFLTSKTEKTSRWTSLALERAGLGYIPYFVSWKKEGYRFDLIIEDSVRNCDKIKDREIFLFDQPWNKNNNKYDRVFSWKEILTMLS